MELKPLKSWKSYFLEFLMIFLAVVMGFLAESYRNQLSDEKKARQLKKAIVVDLKKDLIQLEEYSLQGEFIVRNLHRMDSLLDLNPKEVDQKEYYQTLANYSVTYSFTTSEKSLIQAEELGLLQNHQQEGLGKYSLKYQYFLKDIKLTEELARKTYEDYLKDLVQEMTEPDLYKQVFSFPFGELESKYGIKPVSESTKGKLTYFFAQMNIIQKFLIADADSVKWYSVKLIEELEKND